MSPYARAIASGRIQIDGPLAGRYVDDLRVEAAIDSATLTLIDFFGEQPVADYELKNEGVIRLRFEENAFRVPPGGFVLVGRDTKLDVSGSVDRRGQPPGSRRATARCEPDAAAAAVPGAGGERRGRGQCPLCRRVRPGAAVGPCRDQGRPAPPRRSDADAQRHQRPDRVQRRRRRRQRPARRVSARATSSSAARSRWSGCDSCRTT